MSDHAHSAQACEATPSAALSAGTDFSVILATRDRPELFAEALASVLAQEQAVFEVIVVNDGSTAANMAAYEEVWAKASSRLGRRFQIHTLVHRPRGHGQSYSINFGVALAKGKYVCFLDDDDRWTDPLHLQRATAAIDARVQRGAVVDLFMGNQDAWSADGKRVGTLWLGDLERQLSVGGEVPDSTGCYAVDVEALTKCSGFCHLNCLIVRRALFEQVGGMDEGIRWECDRDIYLKLIEAGSLKLHHPTVMAYHRVPDPKKANNMTTMLGMVEKRLLQTVVMDRALARSHNRWIRKHAREHKAYALKKIAVEFANAGNWTDASHYAGQALGAAPGLKWFSYTLLCHIRRTFGRHSDPST